MSVRRGVAALLLSPLLSVAVCPGAWAVPVDPRQRIELQQPDGSSFTVRPFGDERYWANAEPGAGGRLRGSAGVEARLSGSTSDAGVRASAVRPVFRRTAVVRRVAGNVSVRRKGGGRFVLLTAPRAIPLGSTIDATNGRVRLATARTPPEAHRLVCSTAGGSW